MSEQGKQTTAGLPRQQEAIATRRAMLTASADVVEDWAPLIGDPQTAVERPSAPFLMFAKRCRIKIIVRNVDDVSWNDIGAYTRLSDEQVAKHPALLNRLEPETLMQSNALVGLVWSGKRLVAGALGLRIKAEDGKPCTHWGGLVSDGSQQSIGRSLLACLILGDEHMRGAAVESEAIARVLPDGVVNIASSKTLMRLGFYAHHLVDHPVTLKNPQKGLQGSAEPNEANLRYVALHGDPVTTTECARQALSTWSVAFGKGTMS